MGKHRILLLALVLTLALGWVEGAYAADPPAKAAAQAEKKASDVKPAAAPKTPPGAAPKSEVPCEMKGTLSEKMEKNKKGKEVKVFELKVAKAKTADGKAMAAVKGKTVRVSGKKGIDLAAHVGKKVTITGKFINNRRLAVESIK